jgi:hypothetical protein
METFPVKRVWPIGHHRGKRLTVNYAQWLKHKIGISEIVVVRAAVPESLIRIFPIYCLWNSENEIPKDEWLL